MSKACKRHTLNEHVFDIIDSSEKAYWLGFLMADGYNHETKYTVALRLQEKDREILEKYKAFLCTSSPIYTFSRKTKTSNELHYYCEVAVCSPYLSEQLAKHGCTQNKTYTLEFPDISREFYQSFIRGFFDGDGCLSIRPTGRITRSGKPELRYQFTIAGRESVLLKIQEILILNTGVSRLPLKKSKSDAIKILHYSGNNTVSKIMDYLYKDATIYLKRKHDLYIEYCIPAK